MLTYQAMLHINYTDLPLTITFLRYVIDSVSGQKRVKEMLGTCSVGKR